MVKLTEKYVRKLKPGDSDKFYRCSDTTGFGVKVTRAGRKSFFAEGRVRGQNRTRRLALGTSPSLSVTEARTKSLVIIGQMQSGVDPKLAREREKQVSDFRKKTLNAVFEEYIDVRDLRPKTEYDYKSVMKTVFADWVERPLTQIDRASVKAKFIRTKSDRGKATANKAFRILAAIFEYALAEECYGEALVSANPVKVLNQSRMFSTLTARTQYLTEAQVENLLALTEM